MNIRLANFQQDVLTQVAYELGLNPSLDFNKDHAAALTAYVNRAVRRIWELWDWPELDITEERAFRTIWNSSKQFYRSDPNNNGNPSELFYIPSMTATPQVNPYYQVLATAPMDPPIGTLPTNTTYFQPLSLTNKYIQFDQGCRRSIGRVMAVYAQNPLTTANGWLKHRMIHYFPSENGIQIRHTGLYTVFVRYQIRFVPFTSTAYASGTYQRGNTVLWTDGNCYIALNTTTNPPSSSDWMLIPLPYAFTQYAIYQACSSASEDVTQQQLYLQKAEGEIGREIDKLVEQGQRFPTYRSGFRHRWFNDGCEYAVQSCSASGSSTVTTLTDACQDPYGNSTTTTVTSTTASGTTALISGQDYIDVTFGTTMIGANGSATTSYDVVELAVTYSTDPPPEKIWAVTLTNETSTGMRVYLNSSPVDGNYSLKWKVKS